MITECIFTMLINISDKSILRLTRFSPITPSNDTARLALTQWIRAAGQRNIDALVKVGDYYYHGLGVPDESEKSRLEKAARYYQSASDTQMSALAMWNLGWMYENGVGVPQVRWNLHHHSWPVNRGSRISISPNGIMTWHWRQIPKPTCPWYSPLQNCTPEVSGIR